MASSRLAAASRWLAGRGAAEEVLVLAASMPAAHEIVRGGALAHGAAFGWHRATLDRLASELAGATLAREGRVPVGRLACVAVVARVVQELASAGRLGRHADLAAGPTFARAVAGVLEELRLARVESERLAEVDVDLAALADGYERALVEAGLIDRAGLFGVATESIRDPAVCHPWLELPLLVVDLPIHGAVEAALVAALVERAPALLATTPSGDPRAAAYWAESIGIEPELRVEEPPGTSLAKLQTHLFEARTRDATEKEKHGDDIVVLSAPGENRECVEIARRLQRLAREGVPFDRMAILLRSVEEYRPHLEEALQRAGIPAYFARGATRPDAAGRAFLALLACLEEGYSARRFAEYLSLGEVPPVDDEAAPGEVSAAEDRWVPPDSEVLPEFSAAASDGEAPLPEPSQGCDPDAAVVTAGTLRVPRHWEDLLVEAAVIGGRDRWERRLSGLAEKLRSDRDQLADPEDPRSRRLARDLADLENLEVFALGVLDQLEELPERALWGEWLEALSSLAVRTLRRPERVLAALVELAPMAAVGPVELSEVQFALSERLLELAEPPPESRYGRVFVASAEHARGLCFDVVAIPGLAERLFPRKIAEDPLLLDAQRERLTTTAGPGLVGMEDRLARERLSLRLAVGAAREALILSYPRLDLDQARPRVPSFYALEALHAAEGELPGFDELAARAEAVTGARVGWPAPASSRDAIDEAEYDLALLDRLLTLDEDEAVGTARFLLAANPHLGRALRFRARRWLPRWTEADGLTPPVEGELASGALEAMQTHQLSARAYSTTALQNFSACPYRFFLQAIHRLAPREAPEAIDEMDPLQRGSLVHDVQFALFGRLRDAALLPLGPEDLPAAQAILDEVLEATAGDYRDRLAPAIDRVWDDGINGIRADLRRWLALASRDESGFVPDRFELAFGLALGPDRDPHSVPDPVALDVGIRLRGSIDLVERSRDGRARVTDHKTGKSRSQKRAVIAGGASLQPVLYALAAEKLLPEDRVESGRLYYCTTTGGFEEHEVSLDDASRRSAGLVAEVVGAALREPFLPAAPATDACRFCDYRSVCGPYEEQRIERKWLGHEQLERLRRLREAP